MICVSCSIRVISTFYVRKGPWAFSSWLPTNQGDRKIRSHGLPLTTVVYFALFLSIFIKTCKELGELLGASQCPNDGTLEFQSGRVDTEAITGIPSIIVSVQYKYPLPLWYCPSLTTTKHSSRFTTRPATIHRCTGTSRYFLPRYEYRILNKLSRYLRYIYICINKHGKALSSISAHPPSAYARRLFRTNWREKSMLSSV